MNPFRKIANSLMNWWKGETAPEVSDSTELTGGVMTLNSPSFLESMGLSRRRKTTSEVTYFTCLKMLSETLAKMPIKYYQRTDKGIIEAEQTDTSRLLTKRPNPFMTPTVFWNTVEINRNHYGNAYVYMRKKFIRKKYGGEVKILDLWVMQSNCVQIVVDDAGIFAGKGRLWYVYTDPTSGSQYVFDTSEVMHFKTSFSFDGVTGLPVQQILRDTISGASASQRYMNSLYESGLTAKATLEYTGELNDKAKEALVKSFEDFGSGARNTGKIIPVPLGMKLTPLDIKLSDSQFFELKKYTALQIAAAFGVKPNQINDYSNADDFKEVIKQLDLCEDSILDVYEEHLKEGVTRDKIKSFMAKEKWFSGAELAEYFDVLIDEKAAVAACASDYFEKYNHVPESIKGTATKDIVDAVLAELENRNNAAAEAEKQRIEAEKQDILADLDMYGI